MNILENAFTWGCTYQGMILPGNVPTRECTYLGTHPLRDAFTCGYSYLGVHPPRAGSFPALLCSVVWGLLQPVELRAPFPACPHSMAVHTQQCSGSSGMRPVAGCPLVPRVQLCPRPPQHLARWPVAKPSAVPSPPGACVPDSRGIVLSSSPSLCQEGKELCQAGQTLPCCCAGPRREHSWPWDARGHAHVCVCAAG